MLSNPFWEEIISDTKPEPPLAQILPDTCYLGAEPDPHLDTPE